MLDIDDSITAAIRYSNEGRDVLAYVSLINAARLMIDAVGEEALDRIEAKTKEDCKNASADSAQL